MLSQQVDCLEHRPEDGCWHSMAQHAAAVCMLTAACYGCTTKALYVLCCCCRYDHIVPFFGVCTFGAKLTATLSSTDTFTTSSDYTVSLSVLQH